MMAICPNAQEKLQKEVSVVHTTKGNLNFNELIELPYLDAQKIF
jgi:hypothetical protein